MSDFAAFLVVVACVGGVLAAISFVVNVGCGPVRSSPSARAVAEFLVYVLSDPDEEWSYRRPFVLVNERIGVEVWVGNGHAFASLYRPRKVELGYRDRVRVWLACRPHIRGGVSTEEGAVLDSLIGRYARSH